MVGYPSARFVSQDGKNLSAAAVEDVGLPPSVVDLEPDDHAATTVWTTDPEVPADCRQVTAAGVEVGPPGQIPSLVAKIALPVCTASSANMIAVTAVISGSAESAM
jgi:hypothetical protein